MHPSFSPPPPIWHPLYVYTSYYHRVSDTLPWIRRRCRTFVVHLSHMAFRCAMQERDSRRGGAGTLHLNHLPVESIGLSKKPRLSLLMLLPMPMRPCQSVVVELIAGSESRPRSPQTWSRHGIPWNTLHRTYLKSIYLG